MKERPILFSAPMVRALLAGTKTQTRRVCKPAQFYSLSSVVEVPDPLERGQVYSGSHFGDEEGDVQFASPYGGRGDRLWVRETFAEGIHQMADVNHWAYAADRFAKQQRLGERWKPSIHMPRSASRITLEITGIRVERLQDISADDARAEGCPDKPVPGAEQASVDLLAKLWFHDLWAQINGQASWDANPWVWVVEFRRIEGASA